MEIKKIDEKLSPVPNTAPSHNDVWGRQRWPDSVYILSGKGTLVRIRYGSAWGLDAMK
jgi:hypothetical protein